MIDIKFLRENPDVVKENIKKKFQDDKLSLVDEVYNLDIEYRDCKLKGDTLRGEKNNISASIGALMRDKKTDEANEAKSKVSEMQKEIEDLETKEVELEAKIKEICETLNPKLFDFLKSKNKPIHLPKYIIDECENIIHYIRLLKNDEIDRYEELLSSIVILILHHLIIHMDVEEEENSWIKNFQKLTQDAEFPRYNVDDLCRKTKYSRMQLNRLMAEHLNATPSQYLLEYKLNYAERLLITTDTPISTISEMVGYSSQSTFIKNFKKKFYKSISLDAQIFFVPILNIYAMFFCLPFEKTAYINV